ncbi:MAG: hypothetical protein ACLGI9_22510 [Thermoanaerobaculia bacterium]
MIETLRSETASTHQEDPSIPVLTVTGITFEGGDLSEPRYPSLIDYCRAPEQVRFDPGIQIIAKDPTPFTVLYAIDPAAGVVFMRGADGLPVVQSVAAAPDFKPVPGLSAELLDPTTCRLTWNQAEAAWPSTALRILCEPSGRLLTDPEQVDGGVYLAIVHRYEKGDPIQGAEPDSPEPGTIKILGTDSHGRPRYDLFFPDVLASLPPDLELEISFRVRGGERVQLSLLFSLAPGSDVQFESVAGQVVVKPARPEQLQSTAVSEQGEECTLLWVQQTDLMAVQGQVSSFFLEASAGELPIEIFAERAKLRRLQFDPTVIQPPNCTSGGICITKEE